MRATELPESARVGGEQNSAARMIRTNLLYSLKRQDCPLSTLMPNHAAYFLNVAT
jgi:hypothetical protein